MEKENFQIIEINGVKMEVDLRSAKRVDNFKVGDPVKLLVTDHVTSSVHAGMIVEFEDFKSLPTITVAYLKTDYYNGGLNFAHINSKSSDKYELVAASTDSMMTLDKESIIERMNNEIEEAESKALYLKGKKKYFLDRFGVYFKETA